MDFKVMPWPGKLNTWLKESLTVDLFLWLSLVIWVAPTQKLRKNWVVQLIPRLDLYRAILLKLEVIPYTLLRTRLTWSKTGEMVCLNMTLSWLMNFVPSMDYLRTKSALNTSENWQNFQWGGNGSMERILTTIIFSKITFISTR